MGRELGAFHLPYYHRIIPMRYTAHYFLGTRLLGQSSFDSISAPYSTALFCRTCGEIWGRVSVPENSWQVRSVPCEHHLPTGVPDWSAWPGSFLEHSLWKDQTSTMFWGEVLEHLPPAVLEREVRLALQQSAKETS